MALQLNSELKLLARHSAVYSLGNFMQRAVALLLLPIYTRFLTPDDYGIKELVGLSADVIGILLATAVAGAFYRFYFQYEDEKEKNEVLSTAIIGVGFIGLVALVPLALGTRTMASAILDDPGLRHYFLIAFVALWFQSLNGLCYTYLKAKQKSLIFIFISLGKMVMAISLNIYFIAYMKLGVLGFLISNLITVFIIFLALTIPILVKVGVHFSRPKIVEMIRFGLPLIPAQFGAFVVHLSDRFFLKEYASIAETGLYSLGYRFGALPGGFISDPFNQIFQPRRLEVYKQDNSEYIFGRIFTYFLFVMLFAGVMISVLTQDLLQMMANEEFWPAYQVVPLIVLGTIIFSLSFHFNIGLIVAKQTKYFAYINFSNGAFVLLLNFALIPKFGIYGAAWATIIAFTYKAVLTYYFSSRYFQIHFELIRVGKLLFGAALVYLVALQIKMDSVYLSFTLKFILVGTTYPAWLFACRFFSSAEKEKIAASIKNRSLSGWF